MPTQLARNRLHRCSEGTLANPLWLSEPAIAFKSTGGGARASRDKGPVAERALLVTGLQLRPQGGQRRLRHLASDAVGIVSASSKVPLTSRGNWKRRWVWSQNVVPISNSRLCSCQFEFHRSQIKCGHGTVHALDLERHAAHAGDDFHPFLLSGDQIEVVVTENCAGHGWHAQSHVLDKDPSFQD